MYRVLSTGEGGWGGGGGLCLSFGLVLVVVWMVESPLWEPRFLTRMEEEEGEECYDNDEDMIITCTCCFHFIMLQII